MKDFFLPLAASFPFFAAVTQEDLTFWERIAEKWGIGFIGLGLFALLAWWTAKRESSILEARDRKDAEAQAERLALLSRNNELQEKLLNAVNAHAGVASQHAAKLEQLNRDAIKSSNDHASALRMLVRKMQRPCVAPIDIESLEKSSNE